MTHPLPGTVWSNLKSSSDSFPSDALLTHLLENTKISPGELSAILGIADSNSTIELDLSSSPQVIVAGTTGSGKSSCLHSIVCSLLYRYSPDEVRLLLIDSGGLELAAYDGVPHLLYDAVTPGPKANEILSWVHREVEKRTKLFADRGCRNLPEFNRGITAELDNGPDRPQPVSKKTLPRLVIVIDGIDEVERWSDAKPSALEVIALHGRAFGIHLVCAAQTLNSVTFLTPLRDLFPSRLVLRFPTASDARSLLSHGDGHFFIGNGEGFLIGPQYPRGVKIANAFISGDEIAALISWWTTNHESGLPADTLTAADLCVPESISDHDPSLATADDDSEGLDMFFQQAVEIVINHGEGSTSLLQRRLKIGYGRAARLIDQLSQAGILGLPEGSKPRKVLARMPTVTKTSSRIPSGKTSATRTDASVLSKNSDGFLSLLFRMVRGR